MQKSPIKKTLTSRSHPRLSPLALAVSLVLSLPSQNVKAEIYEMTTINNVQSFPNTGDTVAGKKSDTDDIHGGNLNITKNGEFQGKGHPTEGISIYGGYSGSHSVINSSLSHYGTITSYDGSNITQINLYGGYTGNGNANYNEITIKGRILKTSVLAIHGGHVGGTGSSASASSNSVTVDLGLLQDIGSQVDIYGGSVGDNVVYGMANNNTVRVKGTFTASSGSNSVWKGGLVDENGEANNNTFIFEDGTLNTILYAGYIGGDGNVNGNKVVLKGANVTKNVFAGFTGKGEGNSNTVEIDSSTISSDICGSSVWEGNADNNTIILKSGTVTASGNLIGSRIVGSGTANYNNIFLEGGTVSGTVKGGVAPTSINNKFYVYGNANLSSAKLYGNDSGTDITGNILYFGSEDKSTAWTPASYSIAEVHNFDKIAFNAAQWGKTITIDTLDNHSGQVTRVDASSVAFHADDLAVLIPGAHYDMLKVNSFANGSTIALSATASTFTAGTTLQGTGTVSISDADHDNQNDTVTYTIDTTKITGGDNAGGGSTGGSASISNIIASISALSAQPQTHGVAMAATAATTALNQGADTSAIALINLSTSGNADTQLFSAVGGGATRVETGSHVTLKSLNLSFGIGNNHMTDYGLLSWGVAFETGHGVFHNSYDAGAAELFVSKNGYLNFYGGALLGKFNFNNLYHVNAAFRAGNIITKQNNALYDASTMQTHDVKLEQPYFGFELGGGKIFKFDDTHSVDLYAKYFFLHQGADSFYAGGHYKVHDINSHRLKIAGRYQYNFAKRTAFYAGLGGEYEFDGKAELTLDYGIKAQSSKPDGYRTCAELGFMLKPDENLKGLSVDIGLRGRYGAKYRDIFANAEVKYYF